MKRACSRNKPAYAQRQVVAQENSEARAKRSVADQINVLDHRLGKGQGAKRERSRLSRIQVPLVSTEETPKKKRRSKAESASG